MQSSSSPLCICFGIFVFVFVSVYLSLSTLTIGSGVQGWQACPHNVSLPRCRETRSDCSKKWRHKSWAGAQKGWSGCNIIPTLGDTACSTGGTDPSRSKCLRFSLLLLHIFIELYNRHNHVEDLCDLWHNDTWNHFQAVDVFIRSN